MAEVLVLHGSPGSGKTTQARALSELLRAAEQPHAVLDLDEIGLAWPDRGRAFARTNLAAVWPNYAAVPEVRMILPSVIATEAEREQLRAAVPAARFVVCELTAPVDVLKARVTARETGAYWQQRLRDFVDLYAGRDDLARIRDYAVRTDDRSVAEVAQEILVRAGWA